MKYRHSCCPSPSRSLDYALDLIRTTRIHCLSAVTISPFYTRRDRDLFHTLISLNLKHTSSLMTKKQIKAEFSNEVDILRSTLADVKVKLPGLDAFLLANPVSFIG